MIAACPRVGIPIIRVPDAEEEDIQKATDLGALGVIVPQVDDAMKAFDAGRYSKSPPLGRRSSGAGPGCSCSGGWRTPGQQRPLRRPGSRVGRLGL
jgi:4-hydroxy-2-oxoheptanedioate aldolase